MRVLLAHEKHGVRVLPASTDVELTKSAMKLIEDRLAERWYWESDEELARCIVTDPERHHQAWDFLQSREHAEYEFVELTEMEV